MKYRFGLLTIVISIFSVFLVGCETCPGSIQEAEIGVRINPNACGGKVPEKTPVQKTDVNEDPTNAAA